MGFDSLWIPRTLVLPSGSLSPLSYFLRGQSTMGAGSIPLWRSPWRQLRPQGDSNWPPGCLPLALARPSGDGQGRPELWTIILEGAGYLRRGGRRAQGRTRSDGDAIPIALAAVAGDGGGDARPLDAGRGELYSGLNWCSFPQCGASPSRFNWAVPRSC